MLLRKAKTKLESLRIINHDFINLRYLREPKQRPGRRTASTRWVKRRRDERAEDRLPEAPQN
ncbi:hypothetical protein L484_024654 [Morus notabilis]|uniref:Uncharacterized protein n=1 Tax=Morus notabilis TaxID=981085 RepID=W9QRS2_9ROSA|nr:hypothetical protein L484_024654 [Morus notabilis]